MEYKQETNRHDLCIDQAAFASSSMETSQKITNPLHLQNLEKALNLNCFLKQVNGFIDDKCLKNDQDLQIVSLKKPQIKNIKSTIYNFSNGMKSKKWLKNILLEKSDSEDSDEDMDDVIKDLLKYQKFKNSTTTDFQDISNINQHQKYSTTLLSSNFSVDPSIYLKEKDSKVKKGTKKTKGSLKKKNKKTDDESNLKNINPTSDCLQITQNNDMDLIQTIKSNNSLVFGNDNLLQQSSTNNCLIKPSTDTELKTPIFPQLINTNHLKIETKLLDDIKYDTVLPEEILQCENNITNNFVSNCISSKTDEIVYTNQLPDEIFDTEEESSLSVPSQCQSQPPSSMAIPIVIQPRSQTAPSTPSVSGPNSPEENIVKNIKIKKAPKKKGKVVKNSAENSIEILNAKRRRLWTAIARKEIPKAFKQKVAIKKEFLTNCKKMANWCLKERKNVIGIPKLTKERTRKTSKEVITYWKQSEKNSSKDIKKTVYKIQNNNEINRINKQGENLINTTQSNIHLIQENNPNYSLKVTNIKEPPQCSTLLDSNSIGFEKNLHNFDFITSEEYKDHLVPFSEKELLLTDIIPFDQTICPKDMLNKDIKTERETPKKENYINVNKPIISYDFETNFSLKTSPTAHHFPFSNSPKSKDYLNPLSSNLNCYGKSFTIKEYSSEPFSNVLSGDAIENTLLSESSFLSTFNFNDI